jgi:hypothetical protein
MANKTADPGNVFVCTACGKMSNDRYGTDPVSPGWDESCMLNSIELPKKNLIIRSNRVLRLVSEAEKVGIEEDLLMEKYGVQTNPNLAKMANEDTRRICPVCGTELEKSGGVYIDKCPVHGTQPFEEGTAP